jgi:hypothetical protein
MPEILCPKCKIAVTVYADGSMTCGQCLSAWPSLEDLQGRPRRVKKREIMPVQEFLNGMIAMLPGMKQLDPGSAFASRLEAHELAPEQMTEARTLYYRMAAEGAAPEAVFAALDELVKGTLPWTKGDREAVEKANAELRAQADELPFDILGTANDGLTYFIDRSERLCTLKLGNLTKTQLFLLADRDWWEGMFAGARGRMDLDGAINFLIKAANGKSFDSDRLRGRGCWREE